MMNFHIKINLTDIRLRAEMDPVIATAFLPVLHLMHLICKSNRDSSFNLELGM